MALKYFPSVSAIPLGSGLAIDSDGKLEATGGGGGESVDFLDGGRPDSNYGGIEPIDGGSV
jgi:hypothetical protein